MTARKLKSTDYLFALIAFLVSAVFLSPFYICVVSAFKTPAESALSTLALPTSISFENFSKAIEVSHFGRSLLNSVVVTSIAVMGIVLFSAMTAYVICRNSGSRFYRASDKILLAGIMVPFQVIMIPVYRMYRTIDLLNTLSGIILLMVGSSIPYAVFLMIGFIKSVPLELEEAARMDGCGAMQVFFLVVFPILKPISYMVGILHALWMWNEFNMSVIILQKDTVRTIPIQQFYFFGQYTVNLNLGFASACISMLPVLLFFLFAQRQLIEGITAGAIKG